MATIFWLLLVCTATGVAAQSENDGQDVTIIISASVGVTAAVVIIIVCAGCIYHTRAVKKIRTKVWMRELINCKHRHDLIDTPDKLATLENYFTEQELDSDRLFVAVVEEDEERQRTEDTKEHGLDLDKMFSIENERRRVSDMLHAPDKVKQLYEETEMEIYETNVKGTYSDLEQQGENTSKQNANSTIPIVKTHRIYGEIEKANEKEFKDSDVDESQEDDMFEKKHSAAETSDIANEQNEEEKTEYHEAVVGIYTETDRQLNKSVSEKDFKENNVNDHPDINKETILERNTLKQNESNDPSHENNVSKRQTAEFLSLPEIDQFFNLANETYHRKKKSKTRKTSRKKISNLRKHLKAIISENSGSFKKSGHKSSSKVLKIYTQRKMSKTDISKEDEEHRRFSSETGPKEGLKSKTLQHSTNSKRDNHQSSIAHQRKKPTHKKTRKGSGYVHSAPGTPRNRSLSRASAFSQKSLKNISMTDIGINIGQT
ncbi:interaptin-like [Mercenaria mercenaria]|uniref:interaptin-like n=1 Tax=Mercenaria mercenaria TaxID=6596 RepID=UPI00234FA380|nr:interaptin-like [Mercenaria mercenaria]